MNNNTSLKNQIKEMIKEYETINNINIHAYMNTVANVMFMQIHSKKGIKLFGEREILEMIKQLKQLY